MHNYSRIFKLAAFLLIILSIPVSVLAETESIVRGDIDLYLFQNGTSSNQTGVNDIHTQLGEIISIDVYIRNPKQVSVTSYDVYLTVDDRYFDIVSQGINDEVGYEGQIRPFIKGNFLAPALGSVLPYGNNTHGDSLNAQDNEILGWQLDYAEISGNSEGQKHSSSLPYGLIATFQLRAKAVCDSSTIKIDSDHFHIRQTRYNTPDGLNEFSFKSIRTCYLSVTGASIDPPLADKLMAPNTVDSTLDLDDHIGISSIEDSLFTWTSTGNSQIGVTIDPVTHIVTFTAPGSFNGAENITFSATAEDIQPISDSMRITVDSPPEFVVSAMPDTVYIHEDSLEFAFYLPNVIQDIDNAYSSLTVDVTPGGSLSHTIIADSLYLKGDHDYFGDTKVSIKATDPLNLSASATVPVVVSSVNDAPRISNLPDLTIERNDSFTLDLTQYATDPDGDALELSWNAADSLLVYVNGFQATLQGAPGYLGSDDIEFIVTDPSGLTAADTLTVTLSPATKAPVWDKLPKLGFAQASWDTSLVLWDYVRDADDADSLLTFEITGDNNVDFWDVENGKLLLYDSDNQSGWDRLTISAYDPDGNFASTQTIVFIAPSDGTPIVGGIPDTTMVAGTYADWIDLDDFYFDIDHVDSQMDWTWGRTAGADSSVTLYISPSTHLVRLSSISELAFGEDKIYFTVTDPTARHDADICDITILEDLSRPNLNLPAKIGFVSGGNVVLNFDNFVNDPIYTNEELLWSWRGNVRTTIDLDDVVLQKQLAQGLSDEAEAARNATFTGAESWVGWEPVAFTVMNPLGGAASDTLIVFSVSEDGTPLAGGLTTISLKAGECTNILLDDYFFDADSPEYTVNWSVTGNDSISVDINPISHVATVCAFSDTWQGQETLTFSVTDPDDNSDSMPVTVFVTDAVMRNVLSARFLRNPMQEDYMDLFISARVAISSLPIISVEADEDTSLVSVSTLSTGFFAARYLLPYGLGVGQSGTAGIIMSAFTPDGKSVQDTTRFAYGRAGAKGTRLVLNRVTVTIPDNALSNEAFITVVPVETELSAAKSVQGEIEITSEQYTFSPDYILADKAIEISYQPERGTKGAGVYRKNGDGWVFAGSLRTEERVSGAIIEGGTFALGYDLIAPRLMDTVENTETVSLTLSDSGSGLDPQSISLTIRNVDIAFVYDDHLSMISFSRDDMIDAAGDLPLLTVSDRSGNILSAGIVTSLTPRPGVMNIWQNTPNPFNPATHISFTISTDGNVSVDVYDLLGRKVRTLQNAHMSAGKHSLMWDARDDYGRMVSSGVYLYRILYAGRSETRKMTFLR